MNSRISRLAIVSYILVTHLVFDATMADAESTMRALVAWQPVHPLVTTMDKYIELVETASSDEISFIKNGPEVVPPFEQLEPVQKNIFQFLLTTGSYHFGSDGVLLGIDTLKPDSALIRSSGVFNWIDNHYQQNFNLKLVAITSIGQFQLVLRNPPDNNRIAGRNIRGTINYHSLIRKLDGSPVAMPVNQIYAALEKGVVDGFAFAQVGLLQLKFYEAGAKYLMRPLFGQVPVVILMNLHAFKQLPKHQQSIVLQEGIHVEQWAKEYYNSLAIDEQKKLLEKGMEVRDWGENSAYIRKWFSDGIWELVERFSQEKGKEFHEFAKSAGVINDKLITNKTNQDLENTQ
jgi:TRAP-type mannitol/chloroaromatic compound transport system substrate-binding protein